MSPEQIFSYIVVPSLIFLIRIVDVTLGTIRIISISRGLRYLSAVLGFFEVLIWLVAISQIMRNLNSPIHYIAYAGGFAMGTFVGITIERKISMGNRIVRVVTQKDATDLVKALNHKRHGVTTLDGEGAKGPVKVIFSVVRRDQVPGLVRTIKKFNPNAFFTVEDVNYVNEESLFPLRNSRNILGEAWSLIQKKK